MKTKWTDEQNLSISRRGTALLVSASAGSGKTSVMIERIASLLEKKEVTADEILVLTFTLASGADMRHKLRKRLGRNFDTGTMQIGTFHKFCSSVVKTYFNVAEVDPGIIILDETDARVLQNEVLDEVIAKNYEKCAAAIDCFTSSRSTKTLKEVIIQTGDFLNTREDAAEWISNVAFASYEPNLANNKALGWIVAHYNQAGAYFREKFMGYAITAEAEGAVKILPFIKECTDQSIQLEKVKVYADLHGIALAFDGFGRLGGTTGKGFTDYDAFKAARDDLKAILNKVKEQYSAGEHKMFENLAFDRKICEDVIALVCAFEERYAAKKRERGQLDFVDLEKFALKVLLNPEAGSVIRKKYKYVFVDEYQDTNPVQEKILSLVAGEDNVFMVGDAKQSIYGFRGCEAGIFMDRMKNYEKNAKVVKLNNNFRSKNEILEFVNIVFGNVMRDSTASIDYNSTSKFKTCDTCGGSAEVIMIKTEKSVKTELGEVYDITKDNCDDETAAAATAQAALIAGKIAKLTDQGFALGDIAILGRSRTHFDALTAALEKAGIDCVTDVKNSSAEVFEIAVLNNVLFAASNFYNDVPLVLTMQSFIFGFSPDELSDIKLNTPTDKNTNFYKRITAYIKDNNNALSKRLARFIKFLEKYNALCKTHSVADVLSVFLAEYAVADRLLATPGGEARVRNINNFVNALRGSSFGATVAGYLYLSEQGLLDISLNNNNGAKDCVQIMTMHSSKGLEFPVVFIYDAAAPFSGAEGRKLLVVDKDCGLCVYSTDTDEYIKTPSIARLGADISLKRTQIAEELRLFYVACTRAKKHLVIIGASANQPHKPGSLGDYDILTARSFWDFLAPCVVNSPYLTTIPLCDIKITDIKREQRVLAVKSSPNEVARLKKIFNAPYPHKAASDLVFKNSVSSLTKREEEVADVKPRIMFTKDRGAEYGTRFHKAMQRIDFDDAKAGTTSTDKNVVKCAEVIAELVRGMKVHKELVFLQQITKDGESVLVQGVIDLLAVDKDKAIIVDYKTTNAAPARLTDLYKPQLAMYAEAVKQALGLNTESYIYSTAHGKLLPV